MMCSVDCSPFPSDKVGHGSNHEVGNIVHATGVNGVNHRAPLITPTPMGIESGGIQGGVA